MYDLVDKAYLTDQENPLNPLTHIRGELLGHRLSGAIAKPTVNRFATIVSGYRADVRETTK